MHDFYVLEPEVAGGLGSHTVLDQSVHPPLVSKLHYEFDGWLGDEIVEGFPCFIVTESLARRLSQAGMVGVEFADVEVSASDQLVELHPELVLPRFVWLKVTGTAGRDDFGVGADLRLVVSEKALRVIQYAGPRDMLVEPFG
jgi:hypothetical protein